MTGNTDAFPPTPPGCIAVAVRHAHALEAVRFGCSGSERDALVSWLRFAAPNGATMSMTMNIPSPVRPRAMTFSAPASVRRSFEQHRTGPKTGRTRGRPRLGNAKPVIISSMVGIAAAFIARALDLNDEIATRVVHKAGAQARHFQSIGPVS